MISAPLLDELISETQSAFVPGRMIMDNAITVFECFHKIQHSSNQHNIHCGYKLDLAKAYDRVDWRFLREALTKIGFDQRWVDWVMKCVSSVRYTVRCNGELIEPFNPSRGLRQGDPLSPYLFVFVADGLMSILNKEVAGVSLLPIKVARNSSGISNLLFADDSHLFSKATVEQAHVIQQALEKFQRGAGQLLSNSKCSLLFSEVCSEETREEIRDVLGVESVTFESKYLGLPTPEGRMKDGKFQTIMDRVGKRCSDWSEKFIFQAAKEVHMKSVIQALPAYPMGIFKFSVGLC